MRASHSWKTIALFGVLISAAVALYIFADEESAAGGLVAFALGLIGLSPMRVRDANGNGIADGNTMPPPIGGEDE